jgi:hypothetical protein
MSKTHILEQVEIFLLPPKLVIKSMVYLIISDPGEIQESWYTVHVCIE